VSIEIIGMAGTQEVSESRGTFDGPPVNAGYLTRFAQAHETAGFGPLNDVVDWGKELVSMLREQAGTPVGSGAPVLPA
jgi:hypothetical protein